MEEDTGSLVIVMPAVDDDEISHGLRALTRAAVAAGYDSSGGLLGGVDGYGAWVETEVFGMHPYCWCEEDDCPWCAPCACPEEAYEYRVDGQTVDAGEFYAAGRQSGQREQVVHAELLCARCAGDMVPAPNFWHKPSRSWVTWYKYIGRGTEKKINAEWSSIMAESLASLRPRKGDVQVRPPGYGPA